MEFRYNAHKAGIKEKILEYTLNSSGVRDISRLLPTQQHVIRKDNTWKIERKNLNFRTHIKRLNRRTICYSKNEQVHDNVIGMYIERYLL